MSEGAALAYGVFSTESSPPRVGVPHGSEILDLAPCLGDETFAAPSLAPFLARGRAGWRRAGEQIADLLASPQRPAVSRHLVPASEVTMHMPVEVGDYVDFYSSLEHATNLGRIFRPGGDPLPPSWRNMPLGYHGRAGTVVVSGTQVQRPLGQRREGNGGRVAYGPSLALDFEAEVGFIVGTPSPPGERLSAADFAGHVFGVVVVNDWSARDIQAFEYVPLGPFLGKSFMTSVSAWVVPLDALAGARTAPPPQDPPPLPHLVDADPWALDLEMTVLLNGEEVARAPFAGMYWTPGQQLAHLSSNGAGVRPGDLFASGTVSGAGPREAGSMIELSWNGRQPLRLRDGSLRSFLEDGDTVVIKALARLTDGSSVRLGPVSGTVLPPAP